MQEDVVAENPKVGFFKTKAPFSRKDLEFPSGRIHSRTGLIRWTRLVAAGDLGDLVVRAMAACNDLDTIQFLNRHTMLLTIEMDEGRLDQSEYGGLTMHNLLMHRRWVFRMACVTVDDLEQFFNRILGDRRVAFIRERPDVADAIARVKAARKKGKMKWIKGVRNTSAAHIDADGAFGKAIASIAACSKTGIGKYHLSTKPYEMRFVLADDVLSKLSLDTAWGLAGVGKVNEEAYRIVEWMQELIIALFNFYQIFVHEAIKELNLGE